MKKKTKKQKKMYMFKSHIIIVNYIFLNVSIKYTCSYICEFRIVN